MTSDIGTLCLLECLHTVAVAVNNGARVGDKVACDKGCGETFEVVHVTEETWEWSAQCQDCKFTKYTGKSAHLANFYGGRHQQKWPQHKVRLKKVYPHDR